MPERVSDGGRMRNGGVSILWIRVPAGVEGARVRDESGEATQAPGHAQRAAGNGRGHRAMTRRLLGCRAGERVVVGAIEGAAARVDRLASGGSLPGVALR